MRSTLPLRLFFVLGPCSAAALAFVSNPSDAHASVCGDGIVEGVETCDDGNLEDEDGCDASCTPSGIATLSHGDGTACAVTRAGHVKCWGVNDAGQLGRGDSEVVGDDERPSEVDFVELDGLASSVFTNGQQTFALMLDGSVRAWGLNDAYQLGLGHNETIGDDETPMTAAVSVAPVIDGVVVELSAQGYFACARLAAGGVRCWGANDLGQLGYGHTDTIGDDEDPADAGDVLLWGMAAGLTTGATHACALLDDGAVQCWGANDLGQLGLGHTSTIGDDETPLDGGLVDLGGRAAEQIVAGAAHTCALLDDGAVRCWGDNAYGQLGYDGHLAVGDDETLASVGDVPLPGPAVAVSAGAAHTCAVVVGGQLYCWGANDLEQLGRQTATDSVGLSASEPVDLGGQAVIELYSGATGEKTCARLDDDGVRCWGANDLGQLGLGEDGETQGAVDGSANQFVVVVDETVH